MPTSPPIGRVAERPGRDRKAGRSQQIQYAQQQGDLERVAIPDQYQPAATPPTA